MAYHGTSQQIIEAKAKLTKELGIPEDKLVAACVAINRFYGLSLAHLLEAVTECLDTFSKEELFQIIEDYSN